MLQQFLRKTDPEHFSESPPFPQKRIACLDKALPIYRNYLFDISRSPLYLKVSRRCAQI